MPPNTILVCARAQELRTELETALTDAGHQVVAVATPADAVRFVASRIACLIRMATFRPSGSPHAFSVTSR